VTPSDSSRKSSLIALGTTAVIAVYAAGFVKTTAAAAHFADQDTERRRPAPTVHPEIPVATTTTPAAPRPEQPAAKPQQAATAQAPKPEAKKPETPTVAAAKPAVDTPVAPLPAATTQVTTTPPRDTTPPPTPPKPVATAPAAPTPTPAKTDSAKADSAAKDVWKDGLYFGWGRSRHGDIQAGVEIKAGRIASAFISECLTQYSCSWISQLPPQVVARQSADVDYVSGATQSANAFYYAVMDALKKAK
jgi:uncharacterized protein with FMN-binding domain